MAEDILKQTGSKINEFIGKVATYISGNNTPQLSKRRYSIIYTPIGKPITRLTKNILKMMISCVKKLHQYNIIHRDLSPHHFLMNEKGEVNFSTLYLSMCEYV